MNSKVFSILYTIIISSSVYSNEIRFKTLKAEWYDAQERTEFTLEWSPACYLHKISQGIVILTRDAPQSPKAQFFISPTQFEKLRLKRFTEGFTSRVEAKRNQHEQSCLKKYILPKTYVRRSHELEGMCAALAGHKDNKQEFNNFFQVVTNSQRTINEKRQELIKKYPKNRVIASLADSLDNAYSPSRTLEPRTTLRNPSRLSLKRVYQDQSGYVNRHASLLE